jgi:hypothetical protein
MCGITPVGPWLLSFGADAEQLFASGTLTDILLVISWQGQQPAWT